MDKNGNDQNSGQKLLGKYPSPSDCLSDCHAELQKGIGGIGGCEVHRSTGECFVHTSQVSSGSGNTDGGIKKWSDACYLFTGLTFIGYELSISIVTTSGEASL